MYLKQISSPANLLLVLTALVACQGCSSGAENRVSVNFISNTDIVVVSAKAHRKSDGILVAGDVQRPNNYAGVVPGHLRVVGRDVTGSVVAATDAPWGEFMNRRFRLAYFKTVLRTASPAAIASVSIEPVTKP